MIDPHTWQRVISAEILAGRRVVRVIHQGSSDAAALAEVILAALERGALRVQLQKQDTKHGRPRWIVAREWRVGDLEQITAWRAGQGRRKVAVNQLELFGTAPARRQQPRPFDERPKRIRRARQLQAFANPAPARDA